MVCCFRIIKGIVQNKESFKITFLKSEGVDIFEKNLNSKTKNQEIVDEAVQCLIEILRDSDNFYDLIVCSCCKRLN